MYKLKYYETTGQMTVKYFDDISKALRFSVYKIPLSSLYSIDKVEE